MPACSISFSAQEQGIAFFSSFFLSLELENFLPTTPPSPHYLPIVERREMGQLGNSPLTSQGASSGWTLGMDVCMGGSEGSRVRDRDSWGYGNTGSFRHGSPFGILS